MTKRKAPKRRKVLRFHPREQDIRNAFKHAYMSGYDDGKPSLYKRYSDTLELLAETKANQYLAFIKGLPR